MGGWLSLFNGAGTNIARGMVGAAVLSLFDGVKAGYIERKKNEKMWRMKKEILQFREVRNKMLCEIARDREDWKVIINSVVCVYLDEYMQNESMFALEMSDAFAVRKWKSIR